eukprot:TRINITY_DN18243_c0_g1_i1.p1 TRINITY_DN18243_c0_g1~~TRINITY_DN18243_c0_g1_i1.p1  ORF type:complete len:526 (+),score=158.56 TRINITY_DN18243_c0_g1_i1:88-1665(+)
MCIRDRYQRRVRGDQRGMGCGSSGARDAHGFSCAMSAGHMPDASTLTYQGVFNEHNYLVSPEDKHLVSTESFPILHKGQPWVAVFLKSALDGKPRNADPIDVSVVIDISGSMRGGMGYTVGTAMKSRLEHAQLGVQWLVRDVLRPDDRIAVSTFNNTGTSVQPLTRMDQMDKTTFLKPVEDLRCQGGTTLSAGMKIGRDLLEQGDAPQGPRERRILFLTDMGEMNAEELGSTIKKNAADGVFVSIVALGAAFNSSLTETVTKNKGSNYFCATNEEQLHEAMVKEFDFNMFSAAFEVDLSVRSGSLEVCGVYGTPFDTKEVSELTKYWEPDRAGYYNPESQAAASSLLLYTHSLDRPLPTDLIGKVVDLLEPPKCSITKVDTMFPSKLEADGAMKGGLMLVKLKGQPKGRDPIQVTVDYEDRDGRSFSHTESLLFSTGCGAEHAVAIKKGLLLQEYVETCHEFMSLAVTDKTTLGAHLAKLKGALAEFKQAVAAPCFCKDAKMQQVLETFQSFVKLFQSGCEDPGK